MEVAGLVLGAAGITALFSACIESFDIIVRSREFGNDFDLLCTQISLLQIRLKVWGECLGLVPGSGLAQTASCSDLIDRADVRPAIERALLHLHRLLAEADVVTSRYEPDVTLALEPPISQGLSIFRESFEQFKARIRKSQKQKSHWKVTRWAIHDMARFKALVTNIKDLIEGLEGITIPLGTLPKQQELLAREVDLVSDKESLRLLMEVSSIPGSSWSLSVVCDSSSYRFTGFAGSTGSSAGITANSESTSSYHTAPEQDLDGMPEPRMSNKLLGVTNAKASAENTKSDSGSKQVLGSHQDTPQNQRIMRDIMKAQGFVAPKPSFASGAARHGHSISQIKARDNSVWEEKGPRLLIKANQGGSVARRVSLELRSIKAARIPFMSARAFGDDMNRILASIEGPPDTPYEGGIFWLQVHYQTADISQPPVLRFLTRVYHPNIDCLGNICADYQAWWNDPELRRFVVAANIDRSSVSWFATKGCLGSILTAICGLLASPNVEDPLVPEIAETYVKDHERYREIASFYTRNYAVKMDVDVEHAASFEKASVPADETDSSAIIPDDDSASYESSCRPWQASMREKEKLLYDYEARSERRILAGLDGQDSSSESTSSDGSGVCCEFDEDSYASKMPYNAPGFDSRFTSCPSFNDLEGIFDPEWDQDADQPLHTNQNAQAGRMKGRRHSIVPSGVPGDSENDFGCDDEEEIHGRRVEERDRNGRGAGDQLGIFNDTMEAKQDFEHWQAILPEIRDSNTKTIKGGGETIRGGRECRPGPNFWAEEVREENDILHSTADGGDEDQEDEDALKFWGEWQSRSGPPSVENRPQFSQEATRQLAEYYGVDLGSILSDGANLGSEGAEEVLRQAFRSRPISSKAVTSLNPMILEDATVEQAEKPSLPRLPGWKKSGGLDKNESCFEDMIYHPLLTLRSIKKENRDKSGTT